jgi:hypothetical protein
MPKINDGGPAFPRPAVPVYSVRHEADEADGTIETDFNYDNGSEGSTHHAEEGMSLRAWLAGHAMAAIIAKLPLYSDDEKNPFGLPDSSGIDRETHARVAAGAVHYADALIARLNVATKEQPHE